MHTCAVQVLYTYSANLICARQAAVPTVVAIFIVHGMCLFSWANGPGLRLGCPVSGIVLYDKRSKQMADVNSSHATVTTLGI